MSAVRLGLLALLDSADMYGYQLKTAYESWTGSAWTLNVGQVYSTLDRLERDGLVSTLASDDAEQKHYAITRRGRDVLAEWFATVPVEAELPRDELIAKILLAMANGRDHAVDVIVKQRTSLTEALQARRRSRRDAIRRTKAAQNAQNNQLSSLSPVLVEDAVAARTEAELRWLDLCEARILDMTNRPRGLGVRTSQPERNLEAGSRLDSGAVSDSGRSGDPRET